jgi:hypothetical protein
VRPAFLRTPHRPSRPASFGRRTPYSEASPFPLSTQALSTIGIGDYGAIIAWAVPPCRAPAVPQSGLE